MTAPGGKRIVYNPGQTDKPGEWTLRAGGAGPALPTQDGQRVHFEIETGIVQANLGTQGRGGLGRLHPAAAAHRLAPPTRRP